MISRRSVIFGSFALLMLIAAVVVGNWKIIPTAWHAWCLGRVRRKIFSAPGVVTNDRLVGYGGGDLFEQYEFHRRRLVELGHFTKRKYAIRRLGCVSEESLHFFDQLKARRCPEYFDYLAEYSEATEPTKLVIWCFPEHVNEWDRFIGERDTTRYRERFMRQPLSR